jgi:hypothetical protein
VWVSILIKIGNLTGQKIINKTLACIIFCPVRLPIFIKIDTHTKSIKFFFKYEKIYLKKNLILLVWVSILIKIGNLTGQKIIQANVFNYNKTLACIIFCPVRLPIFIKIDTHTKSIKFFFSSIYAHQGLMNSLGHRKNILKKEFNTLGVGVDFFSMT